MNSDERRSSTRIRFVRSSASDGPVVWSIAAWSSGRTNAISNAAAMPLPVTSAITTLSGLPAATQPEEVEEVATDLARGLVVSGNVVARHVRWRRARRSFAGGAARGPAPRRAAGRPRRAGPRSPGRSPALPRAPAASDSATAAPRPPPDAAPQTRIRPPTSAPAAISRVTASPAGRASEVLAIGVPSAPSIARHRPGSSVAERRDDRVEVELDRDLGRHRRAGGAIRQGRWPRRWPRIGPHGRRTFDRDRFA